MTAMLRFLVVLTFVLPALMANAAPTPAPSPAPEHAGVIHPATTLDRHRHNAKMLILPRFDGGAAAASALDEATLLSLSRREITGVFRMGKPRMGKKEAAAKLAASPTKQHMELSNVQTQMRVGKQVLQGMHPHDPQRPQLEQAVNNMQSYHGKLGQKAGGGGGGGGAGAGAGKYRRDAHDFLGSDAAERVLKRGCNASAMRGGASYVVCPSSPSSPSRDDMAKDKDKSAASRKGGYERLEPTPPGRKLYQYLAEHEAMHTGPGSHPGSPSGSGAGSGAKGSSKKQTQKQQGLARAKSVH